MSYILDALRKSDQQRRRGAAPTLLAVQAPAAAPKQPAFVIYGLLAAALLGAGMAIGWLRPWQAEQAAPGRAEMVAAKPLESIPREAVPARSEAAPQPKPQVPLQNPAPRAQAAPAPVAAKPHQRARATPEPDGTARHADVAAPGKAAAPAPQQPAGAAADAAREPTVISMAELPLSVQQELPPMTISFHAYSANPKDRLVGINNRMLREGDDIAPGLKLVQITPDGMIFGYKGYSFRRGVK